MRTGFLCIAKAPAPEAVAYRGVARALASSKLVVDSANVESVIRNDWRETQDGDWFLFHSSRTNAEDAAAFYVQSGVPCEVLKVTECLSAEDARIVESEPEFLGFDVASLTLESAIFPKPDYADNPDAIIRAWIPVWRLESAYVEGHLNRHGLFYSFVAAKLERDAVTAMRDLVNPYAPGTFLDVEYRVLGVSRIGSASKS